MEQEINKQNINLQNNQEQNNQEPSKVKKALNFIWEITKIVVIASVIVLPIRYFLFQPFIVKGESMVPNFQDGNYLIVDEISYRLSEPKRGDVVVFDTNFLPRYVGQRFIKRVIGLPGETIDIKNSKITISKDGKELVLNEKYLPANFKIAQTLNITLNKDQYFVMGDNRDFSYDSRMWGALPKTDIIGKVFLRVLPITEMKKYSALSY